LLGYALRIPRDRRADEKLVYKSVEGLKGEKGTDAITAAQLHDGFGNLTDKTPNSGSPPALHVTVNPATNHVIASAGFIIGAVVSNWATPSAKGENCSALRENLRTLRNVIGNTQGQTGRSFSPRG
jgi:hypothetical protein